MNDVSPTAATAFLRTHFNQAIADVDLVGAGAWSRCYGFRLGDEALVIRFGAYREDFAKDQLACRYTSPALPVPELLEIGPYQDGFYAISRRAYGQPLESVSRAEWLALIPALVDALEALRTADLAGTVGFGGWDGQGRTHSDSWSADLLTVGIDRPEQRTHGWKRRLEEGSPPGAAAFRWGYDRLQQIASDDVPRNLLHCDLINRNVLVAQNRLTAVFDWGCGRYGDHLYELAWFEFWAPWHPNLETLLLRTALEARWQSVGYAVPNMAERLATCYLHIGLDHLAYNAYLGDWQTLLATADQMKALVATALEK